MSHQDDRLFRVEDKLDSLKDTLNEINITLAAQHESLKEHMSRTRLLEDRVDPLEKNATMTHGAIKLVSGGVAVISAVHSVLAVLQALHKI